MSTAQPHDIGSGATLGQPAPEVHIHNEIRGDGSRVWNVLVTLLVVSGLTVLAYQLSLSGFKELAASGTSIFLVTLCKGLFRAGIWSMPEPGEVDDLAFTKSTLRRVYDELQVSIAKSSVLKLVLWSLLYTIGFLVFRQIVAIGISALTSMYVAIGVGLLVGALVIAQDQILSWLRTRWTRKVPR